MNEQARYRRNADVVLEQIKKGEWGFERYGVSGTDHALFVRKGSPALFAGKKGYCSVRDNCRCVEVFGEYDKEVAEALFALVTPPELEIYMMPE